MVLVKHVFFGFVQQSLGFVESNFVDLVDCFWFWSSKQETVLRTTGVRILSCAGRPADGRRTVVGDAHVVSGAEKKKI